MTRTASKIRFEARLLQPAKSAIVNACQMLAGGKRRVCCFDRSGYYSKSFGAPQAAG